MQFPPSWKILYPHVACQPPCCTPAIWHHNLWKKGKLIKKKKLLHPFKKLKHLKLEVASCTCAWHFVLLDFLLIFNHDYYCHTLTFKTCLFFFSIMILAIYNSFTWLSPTYLFLTRLGKRLHASISWAPTRDEMAGKLWKLSWCSSDEGHWSEVYGWILWWWNLVNSTLYCYRNEDFNSSSRTTLVRPKFLFEYITAKQLCWDLDSYLNKHVTAKQVKSPFLFE